MKIGETQALFQDFVKFSKNFVVEFFWTKS